jgi:NitT/TauT family transport system ATP-binding protein
MTSLSAAMPQQSSPAIQLRAAEKRYDTNVLALGPIDLTIASGSFVALLGTSGCGKSTALRLIAGLAQPSAGRVEMAAQRVGFVFQEPTLMPWASIRGNVGLPLKLQSMPAAQADARIDRALTQVGLQDFAHAMPRELSGGMKMRASLARALVTDPDVLLLDEPFAALDEITRFKLNDDLLDLWRTLGKTIVFVTHSVFESVYLAERVVVMTPRPGRISADLTIAAPRRDKSFRTSADYAAQCRIVSQALEAASGTVAA